MNGNQEHLAFNHQIGRALSEWQNDIEFELYNIKQACSGDKRSADTYITLFEERNFRDRLAQVNDVVSANFSNTPLQADWLKLHSRIEKAAKGRNALAHHWVLIYPNEKPGRRWCLIPRPGIFKEGSRQRLPPGSLCVRDISALVQRFSALGFTLRNFAACLRGQAETYPKHMEREARPLTLAQLTHEIRVLAGCPAGPSRNGQ
jgi:hypothetical protein